MATKKNYSYIKKNINLQLKIKEVSFGIKAKSTFER